MTVWVLLANGGRLLFYEVKSSFGEMPTAFLSMTQFSELGISCVLQPKTKAGLS